MWKSPATKRRKRDQISVVPVHKLNKNIQQWRLSGFQTMFFGIMYHDSRVKQSVYILKCSSTPIPWTQQPVTCCSSSWIFSKTFSFIFSFCNPLTSCHRAQDTFCTYLSMPPQKTPCLKFLASDSAISHAPAISATGEASSNRAIGLGNRVAEL